MLSEDGNQHMPPTFIDRRRLFDLESLLFRRELVNVQIFYLHGNERERVAPFLKALEHFRNNFLTLAECRRTCLEYDNPCPHGLPVMNADGSVHFCTATNPTCPRGHFCHVGENRQTVKKTRLLSLPKLFRQSVVGHLQLIPKQRICGSIRTEATSIASNTTTTIRVH